MPDRIRIADLPAFAAGALTVAYGCYLLLLGPIVTLLDPNASTNAPFGPNPVGLVFIGAGLLVWFGITRDSNRQAWLGAAVATVTAWLLIFSIGGIAIPVAAVLLVAVAIRKLATRQ